MLQFTNKEAIIYDDIDVCMTTTGKVFYIAMSILIIYKIILQFLRYQLMIVLLWIVIRMQQVMNDPS